MKKNTALILVAITFLVAGMVSGTRISAYLSLNSFDAGYKAGYQQGKENVEMEKFYDGVEEGYRQASALNASEIEKLRITLDYDEDIFIKTLEGFSACVNVPKSDYEPGVQEMMDKIEIVMTKIRNRYELIGVPLGSVDASLKSNFTPPI